MKSHRSSFFTRLPGVTALSCLLLLLPGLTGCVFVAAGAGAVGYVAWVRGELDATLGNDYGQVVEATRDALKRLEFVKVSETKDALEADLVYRTALDKKVEIRLDRLDDKSTRVRIRVGLLGDEPMSRLTLERIKERL